MTMRFVKKLYLDRDDLSRKEIEHRLCTRQPKSTNHWYVVSLSGRKDALLEIYSVMELDKPHMQEKNLSIVGVARGYHSAVHIVERIITDVYSQDKDVKVNDYFDS